MNAFIQLYWLKGQNQNIWIIQCFANHSLNQQLKTCDEQWSCILTIGIVLLYCYTV